MILLDDHARVVLNQQDLITGSDYINASHVDVSFLYKTLMPYLLIVYA